MQAQYYRRPLIAGLAALGLLAGGNAMSLEQPDYTVVHTADGIEYRQYEPYLVAETVIEQVADYQAGGNEGFRRLFRYIAGGNRARAKIAMTAPVAQSPARSEKIAMTAPVAQTAAQDGWRVAFMLPSRFTLDTAPEPADPRVRITEVPGRLVAALRYSGRWTASNVERRETQLLEALAKAGVEANGPLQTAAYNGPFMPPFLRRNEVMVPVAALPETVAVPAIASLGH